MTNIHEEIRSLLAAYVMDAVPREEVPAIRAHVLSCEECWNEADSYADALGALAVSVDPAPLPVGFADRVVSEAMGDRDRATGRPARPAWFRRAALSFAAGLAVVAIVITSSSLIGSIQRERRYERIVAALISDDA
ncbi:MAG: zf-HC2 domain-containing protein, partial [Actinobacteria bacterium]|nr:zf-HC2 domain-containing protein [Actinomycetota bacterium]